GRAERARAGAARSVTPPGTDPCRVPALSEAVARVAVRRRAALADDRPALHSPDAARGPGPAHAHRLHGHRVVHVHAEKAVAPRARPHPRPSEPDRAVAALAPGRCGADADRWLGRIDGDVARRSLAADALGPRCVALAHRSGHGPPGSARRASRRGGARLATT